MSVIIGIDPYKALHAACAIDRTEVELSKLRVLGSGRSNKNDANDARSVAVAALRSPSIAAVRAEDHISVLRLLAKAQLDTTHARSRACSPVARPRARVGRRQETTRSDALIEAPHLRSRVQTTPPRRRRQVGPGGQSGNDSHIQRGRQNPGTRHFGQVTPGPKQTLGPQPRRCHGLGPTRLTASSKHPLDTKRIDPR